MPRRRQYEKIPSKLGGMGTTSMIGNPGAQRPMPIRAALVLLWSALLLMIAASLAFYVLSEVPLDWGSVGVHLLGYSIGVTLLLGIGAGNPWARIVFVIFLAWGLGLTAVNFLLQSEQLPWLMTLDACVLALQLCGTYLLFRPTSNDWFRETS